VLCSKQNRRPQIRIQTLQTLTLTLTPPTRNQTRQAPTVASPSILVVAVGIAVVVQPNVDTNHPHVPHPVGAAEPTVRGQGRVPHLGTGQINLLVLRYPLLAEQMPRGRGQGRSLGLGLHHLHHDDAFVTNHRLNRLPRLGIAIVATENAKEKGPCLLAKVPAGAIIAIDR